VAGTLAEVGARLWAHLVAQLEAALPVCALWWRAEGERTVPLDEALGLEARTQHSLGVRECALWLVTELSYAKTVQTLEELRALSISHGELHRPHGNGRRPHRGCPDRRDRGNLQGAPDAWADRPRTRRHVVSAAGTMVRGRAGAQFEAKVGLVFRSREQTGRHRSALRDRRYIVETAT
jgi:hypothetical protein